MKLKIRSSFFLIFLFYINTITSYGQTFDWAISIGNSGWDEGKVIKTDQEGNVYTIGFFKGTVDFNPGAGVYNLSSVGEEDAFICKLDSTGSFIWAKQYGDSSFVESNDLAIDPQGNIFVVGSFSGVVDFDPGMSVSNLTSTGWDRDIFIQKLDAAGNFIWTKQISGYYSTSLSSCPTNAFSIAIDSIGNLFMTGYFDGIVDFDPDPTVTKYLTVTQASDIFVNKLDNDGKFIWAKKIGGMQGGVGYSITLDNAGNVYSTGTIGGTVDFDPGVGVFNISLSSPFQTEYYVSKLDPAGNFLWAKSLGPGTGRSIVTDNNNNVITSGYFSNGFTPLLHKMNSSGNTLWSKELVGSLCEAIALDNQGNIYTTGWCTDTNDFDPSPNVFNLTGRGSYIRKLDASGNFLWAGILNELSIYGQVNINSITMDNQNNLYSTGMFDGSVDFDPGTPTYNLTTPPLAYNCFIHKLANPSLSLGLTENIFERDIIVYPNPTTDGKVKLEFDKTYENLKITLYNAMGQVLSEKYIHNNQYLEMQINQISGVYFLEISNPDDNNRTVVRILKK